MGLHVDQEKRCVHHSHRQHNSDCNVGAPPRSLAGKPTIARDVTRDTATIAVLGRLALAIVRSRVFLSIPADVSERNVYVTSSTPSGLNSF